MTHIDFYVAQDADSGNPDLLVCRFAEKAFRRGHETYILTADPEQSARLDELLWTFNPGSFVPHRLSTEGHESAEVPHPAVLIGHEEPPTDCHDILVSLRPEVPGCFSRFQRVAEFVGTTEGEKQQARARFRFYRDRGYPLVNHTI
ncbi:MAG: DNA polymerase III subunit chi [Acidiferrobacterales bacterium]